MAEITFPRYLPYKSERIYSIQGYIEDISMYIVDKGYVQKDSGKVYIYTSEKGLAIPTFKKDDKGNIIYKDASLDEISESFTIDKTYVLNTDAIIKSTTGDEELYDEDALRDMNAATSIFIPIISESDDCLKQLIKHSIKTMHVNVHMLKSCMAQKYAISNLKAALVGKTKMTIPNFNLWCELLGLDYTITVTPRPNSKIKFPKILSEPLVYTSATDKVTGWTPEDEEYPEPTSNDEEEDIEDIEY